MIRLFRVFIPTSVLALLISEIVLIFSCFIIASYLVLDSDPEVFLLYDGGLQKMSLVVASMMLGLYFQDLYTNLRVRSRVALVQQLCLVIGIVFFLQAFLTYISPSLMLSRWIMITGCGFALVLIPAWRMVFTSVVLRAVGAVRVLFLGSNAVTQEIAARMEENPELGWTSLGYVDNSHQRGERLPGGTVLGSMDALREIVSDMRPDRIVVGLTERRGMLPFNELLDLRFAGIQIEEAAIAYETAFGRVSTRDIRPSQLIFTADLGPQQSNMQLQVIYGFLLALIALVVLSPLMLFISILIKLTSPGPVFYKQTRVGQNGKPFMVLKFRCLRLDADKALGPGWASKDDPRMTVIGRFLRRMRLEGVPQLINVLRGEMSIVGPQAERPEFVRTLSEQIPYYRQRHAVRPGITGWAQLRYSSGESLQDTLVKLEYDLYYIKNLSPALDAYCMLQAAKVVILSIFG